MTAVKERSGNPAQSMVSPIPGLPMLANACAISRQLQHPLPVPRSLSVSDRTTGTHKAKSMNPYEFVSRVRT